MYKISNWVTFYQTKTELNIPLHFQSQIVTKYLKRFKWEKFVLKKIISKYLDRFLWIRRGQGGNGASNYLNFILNI